MDTPLEDPVTVGTDLVLLHAAAPHARLCPAEAKLVPRPCCSTGCLIRAGCLKAACGRTVGKSGWEKGFFDIASPFCHYRGGFFVLPD